ncbi:MAG: phosphoribosyl-AMP cyclohydrolase, partial [Candidatus Bathyarchaeota archaeon]|nr:phosphoribosyl-AMP cyclohydrolase [Candidatus Bathyarchaeota archaeon]
SGNYQIVKEIYFDCDLDSILVKVKQIGVACHLGYRSCFFQKTENLKN